MHRMGESGLNSYGPKQGQVAGIMNTAMSLRVPCRGGGLFIADGLSLLEEDSSLWSYEVRRVSLDGCLKIRSRYVVHSRW